MSRPLGPCPSCTMSYPFLIFNIGFFLGGGGGGGGGDLTDDLLCSYIVHVYIYALHAAIRVLVNKLQNNAVMNKRCLLACVCM